MSNPRHEPFTALYSPHTELELSLLRSRLDAENIPYTVTNDHFGSLYIGVQIESFNRRWILVADSALPQAQVVLHDFLARQKQPTSTLSQPTYNWWDKLRTVLEVVLLGWMVPRRRPAAAKDEMVFDIEFDPQHRIFIATTSGTLTAQGMIALGQELLAQTRWQAGMAVIFDHRQLEFAVTPVEDLEAIRNFHRTHQNQIGHGKSAFVVGPGQADDWLELWQQGNKMATNHRTAVFEEIEEAQVWLSHSD
ncbi:putative signal transducing protein [Desulfuromonas acetoxidans]|uniref:DUF2007 domain-containing protein n=1 Tax=Desulfuromonas acetoxidans (strain DSM 684 / 11070) TaxID=281689 RepID=Q1JYA0_DESA6|nr:hypothetical protein [Desulfuromonas acetoxidans]EAT15306.1 hypothetical protein Dace_1275 [Desulfuromonas acetoxidans DSM 684]MBF0645585.1 hypothetical protein [Desulfuromonas acetoxidans]NVD23387.1 hypothetical protein [Desulfuromonas acetoxidans]NVE15372.1 hypothetical protein [Desulfuromonas acetoxidans]